MADGWIVLVKSHAIWNLNAILALDLTLVVGWGLQTSHVDFFLNTDRRMHTHTHTRARARRQSERHTQRHTDWQTKRNRHTGTPISTCMQTNTVAFCSVQKGTVPFYSTLFHPPPNPACFVSLHYSGNTLVNLFTLCHCITVAIPWSMCSLSNAQRTG